MQKYLAELIGTFILVVIGGISVVAGVEAGVSPVLTAPFGFGLGLAAAIWSVGHISGGHFNPAVTVAMVLDKRLPPADVAGYLVAQVVGATVAALTVVGATWGSSSAAATFITNGPGMRDNLGASFLLEVVLTAVFVLVILIVTRVTTRNPHMAVGAIAWTLVVVHFCGVPFTGTSVNPARSIGPAIIAGEYAGLWVSIVAPIVGAVVAWAISKTMRPTEAAT